MLHASTTSAIPLLPRRSRIPTPSDPSTLLPLAAICNVSRWLAILLAQVLPLTDRARISWSHMKRMTISRRSDSQISVAVLASKYTCIREHVKFPSIASFTHQLALRLSLNTVFTAPPRYLNPHGVRFLLPSSRRAGRAVYGCAATDPDLSLW